MKHLIAISLSALLLSSCSAESLYDNGMVAEAKVSDSTHAGKLLENLPEPTGPLAVAVYDFQDQTGQFKANDTVTDYSSAVTKGGLSVLIKALLDTSYGKWFVVAERGGIADLVKEREIVRIMRDDYVGPDGKKLPQLPPLIYGGLLLEGGIIFYDSNVLTGGAAAGYFGITGSAQYRRDIVTVYLRATDIQTGRVVLAVNSSKTVFSYALSSGVTRYLSLDRLLEAETGFSVNEPGQLAVRQAIETSVYSMIMEGAMRGMWNFKDAEKGQHAIDAYLKRKDSDNQANPFANVKVTQPETVVSKKGVPVSQNTTQPVSSSSSEDGWFGKLFD